MKKIKRIAVTLRVFFWLLWVVLVTACTNTTKHETSSGPIQIDSSRYWRYHGELTLLLGAFNHGHNPFVDGSTLDDNDVDSIEVIVAEIQEMVDAGGNTLRCVLDPGSAAAAGVESFQKNAEGRYDLNLPAGPYWDRLSIFINEAEKRNVIVELEIWDRFDWYGDNWEHSAFNPVANSNYGEENSGLSSTYERNSVYLRHPMSKGVPGHPAYDTATVERKAQYDVVREYQEIYVQKILSLTFPHQNIIYNMNNETSEPEGWGEYWIHFIKAEAARENLSVVCTNMSDGAYRGKESQALRYQLQHPETYDYLDVSQVNSRLRDEDHWNTMDWIADQAKGKGMLLHMTKLYGSDDRPPDPWDGWAPGDTDNAIEEWWQNLIANVAGVRFHRPTSGIGLSDKAKACIRATRIVEEKVKFWDVEPRLDLLTDRQEDEAYLAARPGESYVLYFTQQGAGSVGLNLEEYKGYDFNVLWVNIDIGQRGPKSVVSGGSIATISRPDASAHWVATISVVD